MQTSHGPIIDMTTDGDFSPSGPPPVSFGTVILRLIAFTILLGIGALAFWLALFTLPVLIIGGLALYAYVRFRLKRGGLSGIVVRRFRN